MTQLIWWLTPVHNHNVDSRDGLILHISRYADIGFCRYALFPKRNATLICPFSWCPSVTDHDPRASHDKAFTLAYLDGHNIPDRSGVHIQGIAGPPESTLHPNQGSCSAHS